jgi:hypothetical protein
MLSNLNQLKPNNYKINNNDINNNNIDTNENKNNGIEKREMFSRNKLNFLFNLKTLYYNAINNYKFY